MSYKKASKGMMSLEREPLQSTIVFSAEGSFLPGLRMEGAI
jgi:hypothetical protein